VDEDFLAHYQMNYGFTDTSTATLAKKEADNGDKEGSTDEQLGVKRKAGPQEPSKSVFITPIHYLHYWEWQMHFHLMSHTSNRTLQLARRAEVQGG
jgi:hypothetical protein